MSFEKKLKVRLYTAIAIGIIGIALIVTGFFTQTETVSSLGLIFFVVGLARVAQYKAITKNADTLKKRKIAETDERNVMIWTKARSLSFTVCIIVAALAIIVLNILGYDMIAQVVSYSMFSFVAIYWICYFIISRKY